MSVWQKSFALSILLLILERRSVGIDRAVTSSPTTISLFSSDQKLPGTATLVAKPLNAKPVVVQFNIAKFSTAKFETAQAVIKAGKEAGGLFGIYSSDNKDGEQAPAHCSLYQFRQ
ncbi:hypothetical protein G7046_g6190 [Stylonectria norvegica]|nr:hypothetical protein G7046_g6190 [Stylonectria norvegica]